MSLAPIRERIEENEFRLSPLAAKSRYSRGREREEVESAMRSRFQRDRDRIIHCNSFRRLRHKTQVFYSAGDHYSTRLSHTLEVSQVARTIARALNLNEDLTEAISLGHDLGHTPFGHAGEATLRRLLPGGFHHSAQSLRLVTLLEHDGAGLNLTWEVRDGIAHHSKLRAGIEQASFGLSSSLEGQVVRLADSIAYLNHDLADAMRAHIISSADLPASSARVLGESHSQRIDTMVRSVVEASYATVRSAETSLGQSEQDYRHVMQQVAEAAAAGEAVVTMGAEVLSASNELRERLFHLVYTASSAKSDEDKLQRVLESLYHHFIANPGDMPDEYMRNPHGESIERLVGDYLSGMTDRYALDVFSALHLPGERRRGPMPAPPVVD